jgi:spore maturation protein CgeB
MGYIARQLSSWGSRNLVLSPNGCCQVRFSSPPISQAAAPEFDVVFVGSRIRSRNPLSHFYWVARKRVEFIEACTKRYSRRFGLFGNGWNGNPAWQGPIPYAAQHEAYRRSAVVLGGMPNAYHDYYTSDRVFIAIASGVPFVDYWVSGVDRILQPGRDWWLARNVAEMFRLCDRLLEMPSSERIHLGEEARERVLAHHTQYHRCKEMVEIVRSIRDARLSGRRAAQPKLSFLSDTSAAGPVPDAILGWEE